MFERFVPYSNCLKSAILLLIAVLMTIYTPYELLLQERLRMRPGLPPYEWWKEPPPAQMNIYIYNITNSQRYLSGEDPKIVLDQVGPIVLSEVWVHKDIVFNHNGTMSYTLNKTGIYDSDLNTINLSDTITVYNFPLLAAASYLSNMPFFVKMAFNGMIDLLDVKPIVTMSIHDYLFNNSDTFHTVLKSLVPKLVPFNDLGIANVLYHNVENRVTMFMGTERGNEQFAVIDKYDGTENVPGYNGDCKAKLTNATEILIQHQDVKDSDVIYYLREQVCRLIPIYFEKSVTIHGLPGKKFSVKTNFLHRLYPEEEDCYRGSPTLPNGLSDMSSCWNGLPMVSSYPHFDYGDESLKTYVNFTAEDVHELPYVILEPVTGIPFKSMAVIQINILMKELRGFRRTLDKFSDTVIPLIWFRCEMKRLPWYVIGAFYLLFTVRCVQWLIVCLLVFFGFRILWKLSKEQKPQSKKFAIVHKKKIDGLEKVLHKDMDEINNLLS